MQFIAYPTSEVFVRGEKVADSQAADSVSLTHALHDREVRVVRNVLLQGLRGSRVGEIDEGLVDDERTAVPVEDTEQAEEVGSWDQEWRRVVRSHDDREIGLTTDRFSGEPIYVELEGRRIEREFDHVARRGGVRVLVERRDWDDELCRQMARDDLDQLGGSVADQDPARSLANQIADEPGYDVLRDRVVPHQLVDLAAEQLNERFGREMQVVQVGVIDEAMAPVAAVLGLQRIVFGLAGGSRISSARASITLPLPPPCALLRFSRSTSISERLTRRQPD